MREIRLHKWYTGDLHHHQNDIALVVLETPFEFSSIVGPICWNLGNRRFDNNQLSAGSEGKVPKYFLCGKRLVIYISVYILTLPCFGNDLMVLAKTKGIICFNPRMETVPEIFP